MSARRGDRDKRGERGVVGGVEVLPLAFLVFVTGSLLILDLWAVIDAKLAVDEAARQGARALVEAPAPDAADHQARAAATVSFRDSGRDPEHLVVTLSGNPFVRCTRIVVRTRYVVRGARLPFIGRLGSTVAVEGHHTELANRFGSGQAGSADCG